MPKTLWIALALIALASIVLVAPSLVVAVVP